jgi:hypothetical protein
VLHHVDQKGGRPFWHDKDLRIEINGTPPRQVMRPQEILIPKAPTTSCAVGMFPSRGLSGIVLFPHRMSRRIFGGGG